MNPLINKLVSPSAFSLPTWILAFLPSATTAVLHDRNLYGGSLLGWLISAIIGALLAGLIILLAHFGLPKHVNLMVILGIFFLAGAARGIGVGVTAYSLELVQDPQIGVRLISGGILATFWLSISTIIVASFRSHKARRQQLLHLESEAKVAKRHLSRELNEIKLQTGQEVYRRLDQIDRKITAQIQIGDPSELRKVASSLHDLSSDVVRPLSHSISDASPQPLVGHNRTRHRTAYLTLLSDAFTVNPFSPWWTAILLFPSILMTAIRAYGIGLGVFGAAWIAAMASLVLLVGQRAFASVTLRSHRYLRTMFVILVWLIAAISSSLPVFIASLWGLGPERAYWIFGIPLLAYVPVTCLGLAIATALQKEWEISDDELQSRIESLNWQSMRVEQEIWATRNRLGRHLHGSVQSVLTATALFIETSLDHKHDPRTVAIEASERLAQITNSESSHEISSITVKEVLHRIASVWSRLASMRIEITPDAERALDHDPLAAEHVVELVREGITNAIRHGKADNIVVKIAREQTHLLCVDLYDNGQFIFSRNNGLGTKMLNEMCLSWTRTPQSDGGTHLKLILTVGSLDHDQLVN